MALVGAYIEAIDFTTVEVWTKSGLVTFYLLFVMELKTRQVHFAGCTISPHEAWMKQMARELTDCEDGFLNGKQYLIMDRDTRFCESFRQFLNNEGIKPVRLPPRSPNMNAHPPRAILRIAQIRVPGQTDSFWRKGDTPRGRTIPGSLSH